MIVGIDPGTTVAWAVLDLNGCLVACKSARHRGRDEVVRDLSHFGRIFLVGCDKTKVPSFVQEVAVRLGAKVVAPRLDTSVEEKREMTRDFSVGNIHELDAVACALLAFKKVTPLLSRIRSSLERVGKSELFERVSELVIKYEVTIHSAIAACSPKVQEPLKLKEELQRDEDLARLYGLWSRARKDVVVLERRAAFLQGRVDELMRTVKRLEAHAQGLVRPKERDQLVKEKESRIVALSARFESMRRVAERFRLEREFLERVLVENVLAPLPYLSHFGVFEVEKVPVCSAVFVLDVNGGSERAIELLRDKGVELVVTVGALSARASSKLPFGVVRAKEYTRVGSLVLVGKTWLEKVKSERLSLAKLVQQYQKERALLRG